MAMLANLKLTQAKKPAQIPPVQVRRNKLGKRLHEQIELARAEQAGSTYSPKRYKSVKDEKGNRRTVEIAKRHCPARFDWSSVEVSLGGPFAGYRDDPRAGGEPPGLGRRGSIAESAVRSNSVVVMSPLLDQLY